MKSLFHRTTLIFTAILGTSVSTAFSAEPGTSMETFVRRYTTDEMGVSRFYDMAWSESRFERLDRIYNEWRQKLQEVDFDALDQQGKIDYVLMRNKLTEEKAHLALEERWLGEMEPLVPFRKPIQELDLSRRTMQTVKPQPDAEILSGIPDQIKKLRARIEKTKPEKSDKTSEKSKSSEEKDKEKPAKGEAAAPIRVSPTLARRSAEAVDSLRNNLRSWYMFYEGFQPEFSWWVNRPYVEAVKSLEEYSKYLREEIAGLKGKDEDPLIGDPIGNEALIEDLAAEHIIYTPKELIAVGEQEFAWCEDQMKKAAAAMGYGTDWKKALSKVKSDYVQPGQQDEYVADVSHNMINYLKANDLVTIPPLCEETWRLTMSSPEMQKTLPFAAYGGQAMMVAYAKDEMKYEDKLMSMRGNNKAFTRIVVPHELIPGHHLQGFMAERNRPYRSAFRTPFLIEGWALYWELRLWDLGYGETPEERIGMLFWHMHRCARIIVSLKFHLKQMTPPEMIDFLVDRVGHERLGATGEVRRFIGGGYSPLYQCGYLLGGMQLHALRHEIVDQGKMTDRQFNDTVLTYGTIPVEMIRAGMLNLPLTRNTKPSWKFADESDRKK